jgi:chemotaxis protein histidine kinase CheA
MKKQDMAKKNAKAKKLQDMLEDIEEFEEEEEYLVEEEDILEEDDDDEDEIEFIEEDLTELEEEDDEEELEDEDEEEDLLEEEEDDEELLEEDDLVLDEEEDEIEEEPPKKKSSKKSSKEEAPKKKSSKKAPVEEEEDDEEELEEEEDLLEEEEDDEELLEDEDDEEELPDEEEIEEEEEEKPKKKSSKTTSKAKSTKSSKKASKVVEEDDEEEDDDTTPDEDDEDELEEETYEDFLAKVAEKVALSKNREKNGDTFIPRSPYISDELLVNLIITKNPEVMKRFIINSLKSINIDSKEAKKLKLSANSFAPVLKEIFEVFYDVFSLESGFTMLRKDDCRAVVYGNVMPSKIYDNRKLVFANKEGKDYTKADEYLKISVSSPIPANKKRTGTIKNGKFIEYVEKPAAKKASKKKSK